MNNLLFILTDGKIPQVISIKFLSQKLIQSYNLYDYEE